MFGEKWAGAIAVKGGTQVAVVAGTQAGGQLAVGASTVLTKVLTFVGGLSSWATFWTKCNRWIPNRKSS